MHEKDVWSRNLNFAKKRGGGRGAWETNFGVLRGRGNWGKVPRASRHMIKEFKMQIRANLSFELLSWGLSNQEVLVDVGDHTSAGDGGLDEQVQFFITTDGQLQVSGGDSPHLEVL